VATQAYEVSQPILNSPYEEPTEYWNIVEGESPQRVTGKRRPSFYFFRPTNKKDESGASDPGTLVYLELVNQLRDRVREWRGAGYPGVTRTTLELLQWWQRDGRQERLFFAQLEAAETVIFLNEARSDFRQGIVIPRDEPSDDRNAQGYAGFSRLACKMATGSGKTTVMAMLAAWSILNKLNAPNDSRFSSTVLVVCPNVTIRDRLQELLPDRGAASLYRTRDLVPDRLMPTFTNGSVIVTNWHALAPLDLSGGNRVDKRGEESDTALVQRLLRNTKGGKQNILVLNDEAHHAYRVVSGPSEDDEEEESEEEIREATVWIEGLDKIQKVSGINFAVDLSATPYFLVGSGPNVGRPFAWIVSDFSLVDAIESGLVKIPQLAVRDTTGAEIPGYFNIWRWIIPQLTSAERGGTKAQPKPEAILKYAQTPITLLGGLYEDTFEVWSKQPDLHPTPPVFILVCRNTRLAKVIYEWLAEGKQPANIAPSKLDLFRNRNGRLNTIRIDSKVVSETDSDNAKDDEKRWLRFTLDTVGHTEWPRDSQEREQYPPDFAELAAKLDRPLHPPGRDLRCIVSVGMLTEGWDCRTVTHIVGLRPFMSQLLCEQVVGRGLRRTSYEVDANDRFTEELSKVFGVPFEVIPFKTNPAGPTPPPPKRWHIHPLEERVDLRITFPRVEGYTQAIRNRVRVNWDHVPRLSIEPDRIPPEVEVKGLNVNNKGKLSLNGPGKLDKASLDDFRKKHRVQELEFDLAAALTKSVTSAGQCQVPAHVLFPQIHAIVRRFLAERVDVVPPADLKDCFLSPYYGWLIEILTEAIRPDTTAGEVPEIPRYEMHRGPGSTDDVDFWTSRDVREVIHSHLNYVVADTKKWEQTAAYYLDTNANVISFAKNAGLGFAIPYFHNDQDHDYVPDFLVRLNPGTLILETKGYDPLEAIKVAAAQRWVDAVNADGNHGRWFYRVVHKVADVPAVIEEITAVEKAVAQPFLSAERHRTDAVPLMTLKAAAGSFGNPDSAEVKEWVVPKTSRAIRKGMFVAQVAGKSMEPRIPDGAFCLFAPVAAGSRNGKILLVQHHAISDPETGGSYTVKKYESSKKRERDGSWSHVEVRLLPLNPKFTPIVLKPESEDEVRPAGELIEVLPA
jgi:type III restriction enzyme